MPLLHFETEDGDHECAFKCYLQRLESEAIFIIREVAAQFRRKYPRGADLG